MLCIGMARIKLALMLPPDCKVAPQSRALLGLQGDSGFVCVRDGAIIRQSEPLQHFFDCPFQFAAVPEHTNATDYAEVRPGCRHGCRSD